MVEHFCAASLASGAEVTAGVTASAVLLARYPQSRRTYLTFRDERSSGSNLFILSGPAALRLPAPWLKVEPQRHRPCRVPPVVSPSPLPGCFRPGVPLDDRQR